ncbi:FUSC family protein [Marinimicrococcus flavescens]|uniref:FUSC family protein n=1 Tax=Marinimicrococcus flavescens TaxID=3031815 RepID=A0AAP3XRZ1_9PROT|nr:FUSC family protein [Marinimicrococcus flavescens]
MPAGIGRWGRRLARAASPARLREPLRHACRTAAAALLAYLVMRVAHLPEASWAVMSALYVIRPSVGGTLGSLGSRVAATILGSAVGLALLLVLGQGAWQTPLALALSTAIIQLFTAFIPGMMYAHMVSSVLVLVGVDDGALMAAVDRSVAILCGALAAGAAVALVFPSAAHRVIHRDLGVAVRRCGDLLAAAVAHLFDRDAESLTPIHDDIRAHLDRAIAMAQETRRRRVRKAGPAYHELTSRVQRLWQTMGVLDRIDGTALPDPVRERLQKPLDELVGASCRYFHRLGTAIEAGKPPPRPDEVRERLEHLNSLLEGGSGASDLTAVRVYTLGFVLQAVADEFDGLAGMFEEGARQAPGAG